MCGIVAALSFDGKPVNKIIKKQFKAQRTRGIDGFGLFDYEYKNLVRETMEHNILKWLDKYPSSSIMFHHRLPTSTVNVKSAAHPFSTKDFFRTNYVLVHNGIIYNSDKLKGEHEKLGISYSSVQPDGSFNDSEALLWDVALYLEGKQDGLKAEGAIAFICIALGKGNKHDRMYFGRNSNPLNFFNSEAGLILSSEGAGEAIEPHTLYEFDYVNRKLKTRPLDIDRWVSNYSGSYESYKAGDGFEEDWDFRPNVSALVGERLVRYFKVSSAAVNAEAGALYRRIMTECDGWYSEALELAEYEYDCLTLLHNELVREDLNTTDVSYTLNLYEKLVGTLEIEAFHRLNNPLYQLDLLEA